MMVMGKADVCIVKAKVKFREVMKETSRGRGTETWGREREAKV